MPDLLLVLIIVLIGVVLWRGPKTLPQIGAALGRGYKEARSEATKAQAEIQARASGEPPAAGSDAPDTGGTTEGTPGGNGTGIDRPA